MLSGENGFAKISKMIGPSMPSLSMISVQATFLKLLRPRPDALRNMHGVSRLHVARPSPFCCAPPQLWAIKRGSYAAHTRRSAGPRPALRQAKSNQNAAVRRTLILRPGLSVMFL